MLLQAILKIGYRELGLSEELGLSDNEISEKLQQKYQLSKIDAEAYLRTHTA